MSFFGGGKAALLRQACFELLREHEQAGELPTNGHFVFYELEQRGVVSKQRTGARLPTQGTVDALMWLREHALIPWDWIIDETRFVTDWQHAPSVHEYALDAIQTARINPWGEGQPPLVLVESRSLGGVLRVHAATYVVPIAATNGQVGGFLRTDIAPLLPRQVLYLGDHDLAGDLIEANTRRVLEREIGGVLDWTRIAITADQATDLAANGQTPIIKSDRRFRPARTHEAWETEALGQTRVAQLVREALEALLPEPLEDVLEREQIERDQIANLLGPRGSERPA